MQVSTIGLDVAKNVFQVHGIDERGRVVLRKRLARAKVLTFFANLPPCLVGLEACGGAHSVSSRIAAFRRSPARCSRACSVSCGTSRTESPGSTGAWS